MGMDQSEERMQQQKNANSCWLYVNVPLQKPTRAINFAKVPNQPKNWRKIPGMWL